MNEDFYIIRIAEMLGEYDFIQLDDGIEENQFCSDGRFYYAKGRKRIDIIDTTGEFQPYSYTSTSVLFDVHWIDNSYDLLINDNTRIEFTDEGFRANQFGR